MRIASYLAGHPPQRLDALTEHRYSCSLHRTRSYQSTSTMRMRTLGGTAAHAYEVRRQRLMFPWPAAPPVPPRPLHYGVLALAAYRVAEGATQASGLHGSDKKRVIGPHLIEQI